MPAPILFPTILSTQIQQLPRHYFLAPTLFSAVAMILVLPKHETMLTNDQRPVTLKENLWARVSELYPKRSRVDIQNHFNLVFNRLTETHNLSITTEPGLERLELRAKVPSQEYVIHFPGNAEEAMNLLRIDQLFNDDEFKHKNHLFWNYPGLQSRALFSFSIEGLIVVGIQQVQYLLDQGVRSQDITLNGSSLGGGIATQVARRLSQTDFRPNLRIERSFSSISAIAMMFGSDVVGLSSPRYKPFVVAMLTFGVLGLNIGLIVAGILCTTGLIGTSLIAGVGCMVAYVVYLLKTAIEVLLPGRLTNRVAQLEALTILIHTKISQFATWLQSYVFNPVASVIGLFVAILSVLMLGGIVGGGVGALYAWYLEYSESSVQYGPLHTMLKLLAVVAHVEMDSVAAIQHILAHTQNSPKITVINTENDRAIPVEVALNTGLQFGPRIKVALEAGLRPRIGIPSPFVKQVNFFWYAKGDHNEPIEQLTLHNIATMPTMS